MKIQHLVGLGVSLCLVGGPVVAQQATVDTTIAPDEFLEMVNPVEAGPQSLNAGKLLWEKHCLMCHGTLGKGDGPNARLHQARKNVAPRDLTDPDLQENIADGEIFWRVSKGLVEGENVVMPPYEEKIPSDMQRWQLVHFVRSLGGR